MKHTDQNFEADSGQRMSRREVLRQVSALLGGIALVGGPALLLAADVDVSQSSTALFTTEEIAWLDEVADTILPETGSPGARAAGVGTYMAVMVTDVYEPGEQKIFKDGMKSLEDLCQAAHGTGFIGANARQRLELLNALDKEQLEFMRNKAEETPSHYFRMIKELTVTGYFTSEIGMTQAMRYSESPGRWDPCVPYKAGEKAWA